MKCVMVIDSGLPLWLRVNTAGLLGATLGRRLERIIGTDVVDASGESHMGILNLPLPILSTYAETIKAIREKTMKAEDLLVVDFTKRLRERYCTRTTRGSCRQLPRGS